MSASLLILYPAPKNAAEFDRAYREDHLPYAASRLVGATSLTSKRVLGPGANPVFWLVSDVNFPTAEALLTCALSKGGQQALAHAASISTGGAPLVIAVVDEPSKLKAQS